MAALGAAFLAWLVFADSARGVAFVWSVGLAVLGLGSWLAWRAWFAADPWRRFALATADVHLVAAGLLFLVAAPYAFHWQITSDGGLYFANLRSVVFDRDLFIRPELEFLGLAERPHSIVPIGPTILWAPLYLVVALVDGLIGLTPGSSGVALGLEGPYVRAALVASWLVASAGVLAMHWRLRREFGSAVAVVTSFLMVGATPLVYYMVVERAMPHAASFGVVALLLAASDAWCRARVPTTRQALALGGIVGLATLVRPQDGLFGLFPIVMLLLASRGADDRTPWFKAVLWVAVGTLPLLLAQGAFGVAVMAANKVPYLLVGDGGYLRIFSSRWMDVLFSSRHGLLAWTPVVTVALAGTVAYLRRDLAWAASALLIFAAMCWVNGATADWAGGSSFGGRRFTSTMAAFAPGLAIVVAAVLRRPMALLLPVAAGAIALNHLLVMQLELGMMTRDEAIRFGRLVRQQAEVYTRPPFFYPFAFPANALFAAREGLPIDAYDVLGVETPHASLDVAFDEANARYLISGWRDEGPDEFGPRRFIDGETALLAVPLDVPAGRPLALSIRARAGRRVDGDRPVVVAVEVNGQEFGRLTLTPAADPVETTFSVPADQRGRVWRKGINRLHFRRLAVGGPALERGGGPAVVVYSVRLGAPSAPVTR